MMKITAVIICMMLAPFASHAAVAKATLDGRFHTPCISSRVSGSELCRVSFYKLIAQPEAYQDRNVEVTGFIKMVFGRPILFPSRESFNADIQIEGIEIFNAKPIGSCQRAILPAVVVIGRFDARYQGADIVRLGSIRESSISCVNRIPEE